MSAEFPRCGSCVFWGSDLDEDQAFRECKAVKHDCRGHTTCYQDGDDPTYIDSTEEWIVEFAESEDKTRRSLAVVVDGSGYFAALKCRSDFGCVMFSPKEAI